MFIAHRINTLQELQSLPENIGIELDVRDSGGHLLVTHDPFVRLEDSILLKEFLQYVGKRFLIVNIKSEGIECAVLSLLQQFSIQDFFLLDCSFPMIVKLAKKGEKRIAVRYSEYESLETVLSLEGKISWIWVDCFTRFVLDKKVEEQLHDVGFKLCIVSPELQQQPGKVYEYFQIIQNQKIKIDAVCSKYTNKDIWNSLF